MLEQETLQDAANEGDLFDVEKIATRLWSSAKKANGRELCSYLNQAIREDNSEQLEAAMPLIRGINQLCVTRGGSANRWPADNRTYRGAGLPIEHRSFFIEGKSYGCGRM